MVKHELYSWEEIKAFGITKGELMGKAGLPEKGVDYALPQPWVDTLIEKYAIDSQMLLSTTVMLYNEEFRHGIPICVCKEVHFQLNQVF